MPKVLKDTPLSELTLRKYELPSSAASSFDLSRKVLLSLGLLQPGDSRDVIVDVFHVLYSSNEPLNAFQIEEKVIEARKERKAALTGIAPSNIRRQLGRLKNAFLIGNERSTYRVRDGETLVKLFEEHVEAYHLKSILTRVKEYLGALDEKALKNQPTSE